MNKSPRKGDAILYSSERAIVIYLSDKPFAWGRDFDDAVRLGFAQDGNLVSVEMLGIERILKRKTATPIAACPKGHLYIPENRGIHKNGHRYCILCKREDSRRRRRLKRKLEPKGACQWQPGLVTESTNEP